MNYIHPGALARLARSLRALTPLRGWRRAASALAGAAGEFEVANDGIRLRGDLSSLIEREFYLHGGYEREEIGLFLSLVPTDRRGTILDIGANIGTHSLRFSQAFERVLSFEPNPLVIHRTRRNVALNPSANIAVHHVGLGDAAAELDMYAPASSNQGLGTFLTEEQYDRPLAKIGVSRIEIGDDYIAAQHVARVDAIKCDVQGFEVQVFRGLQKTIQRDRPVVWIEIGSGAHTIADEIAALLPLLPHPVRCFRMSSAHRGPLTKAILTERDQNQLDGGDWVFVPQ